MADPVSTIVNVITLLGWSKDILVRGKGALDRTHNGIEYLEIVLAEVDLTISIAEMIKAEPHFRSDLVTKTMTLLHSKATDFHSKLKSFEAESNKSKHKSLNFIKNFIKDDKDELEIAKLMQGLDSTKLTLVLAIVASPAGVIRTPGKEEVTVDVAALKQANDKVNRLFDQHPELKQASGVGPNLRMIALIGESGKKQPDGNITLLVADLDKLNESPSKPTRKQNLIKGATTKDGAVTIGRNLRKDGDKLDDDFDNQIIDTTTTNGAILIGGSTYGSVLEDARDQSNEFQENAQTRKQFLDAIKQLPLEKQIEELSKLDSKGRRRRRRDGQHD